jgi:hypothetical protein
MEHEVISVGRSFDAKLRVEDTNLSRKKRVLPNTFFTAAPEWLHLAEKFPHN